VAETAKLLAIKKPVFDQFCDAEPRLGMKLMRNIVRLFVRRVRDNSEEYRQMLLWSLGRIPAKN
jgi:hypothetical protein